MMGNHELTALDIAFNTPGADMHVDTYNRRRTEIIARAAAAPAPVPVVAPPAPTDPDGRAISFGSFMRVMHPLTTAIKEKIAHSGAVADQRLNELSARLNALEENSRGSVARLDKNAQMLESLERRASRHGSHLANLEDRLAALERGVKK